jgi:transposase
MYARQRIRQLTNEDTSAAKIIEALRQEGITTCRQTVWRIQRHIEDHSTVEPLHKSGRPTKLSATVLQSIENSMQRDDETTGKELVTTLRGNGVSVSTTTVLKGRRLLGWTRRGTAYCQVIRAANRIKRLEWACENVGASFENVIWSDETSVQMESHRRFHCYKKGLKPRYKPRPKHPVKVHVWAGISCRGATGVCIFDGIMDASMYTRILKTYLIPFIRDVYPTGHRFMQDNDPKHTSRRAQEFFEEHSINWWKTPPESPDANPIEDLWHELKVFTCTSLYSQRAF